MGEVAIRAVDRPEDLDEVRALVREYAAFLTARFAANERIHIEALVTEAAGLPVPYVAPGGLWVALVDGEVAGCVALKPIAAGSLELKRLWVREGFRGLKLGKRMMQTALDHARASGAEAVYLDTVPAVMPEANRLYEAMGFERVARYNDNPVEHVVFFRLGLR